HHLDGEQVAGVLVDPEQNQEEDRRHEGELDGRDRQSPWPSPGCHPHRKHLSTGRSMVNDTSSCYGRGSVGWSGLDGMVVEMVMGRSFTESQLAKAVIFAEELMNQPTGDQLTFWYGRVTVTSSRSSWSAQAAGSKPLPVVVPLWL